jgi:hypothetical protein
MSSFLKHNKLSLKFKKRKGCPPSLARYGMMGRCLQRGMTSAEACSIANDPQAYPQLKSKKLEFSHDRATLGQF